MNTISELAECLSEHRALCSEVLETVQMENALFRAQRSEEALDLRASRKNMLAKLNDSLNKMRELRMAWSQQDAAQRQRHPEIAELMRENQNLIMRILVLDRENEQSMLRQGLVPAQQAPSATQQRPHFVANLYQRNAAVSG